MKSQFYRFYLLLVAATILFMFSFNELYGAFTADSDRYAVDIEYLLNEDANPPALKRISIDQIAFPQTVMSRLNQGETVALADAGGDVFYYKKSESPGGVLQYGPLTNAAPSQDSNAYIVMLFYSLLAILVLFFMYPLFTDLRELQNKSQEFGKNPKQLNFSISTRSSVYPLASAFTDMSNNVLRLLDFQKDLTRVISHEVRTPLTRIKFLLEIVSNDLSKDDKDSFYEDIAEIEQLTESYLSFARADSVVQPAITEPHYTKAFFSVLENKFAIYQNNFQFRYSSNIRKAHFDRDLMLLATQNLISNALRYSDSKIVTTLTLTDGYFELSVEDDGPGLVNDDINLVQAFNRGHEIGNDKSGFGLGLYIVQKVVLWHHGEFLMGYSDEHGGAKMTLKWPASSIS